MIIIWSSTACVNTYIVTMNFDRLSNYSNVKILVILDLIAINAHVINYMIMANILLRSS